MKRVVIVAAVITLVVATTGLFAQAKPSFTGKWTMVVDPNGPGPGRAGRAGGLGLAFAAAQDEKTLTVTTNDMQMGEVKTVYNLDGSESKNPITFSGNTAERNSKVKWDGSKLVITTTLNFGGDSAEMAQTWSLDASGNLIVETTSTFQGTQSTTKVTYKKG